MSDPSSLHAPEFDEAFARRVREAKRPEWSPRRQSELGARVIAARAARARRATFARASLAAVAGFALVALAVRARGGPAEVGLASAPNEAPAVVLSTADAAPRGDAAPLGDAWASDSRTQHADRW